MPLFPLTLFFYFRILASSCRQEQKLGYYGRTVGTSTYNFLIIWVIIIAKIMAKEVAFHLQMVKKCEEIIINDKSTPLHSMISKTTTTVLIIAMLSLVGLTALAGVSQTVFAQTIAEEAVDGTAGEGFFDDEGGDSIGGGGGTADGTGAGGGIDEGSIGGGGGPADGTGAGGGIGDCQTCGN